MRAGQDDIQTVATKYGFDVAWLGTEKKSKGSKRTKGSIEDLERQLADAKRRQQADSGSPDRALAPAQCNTRVQAQALPVAVPVMDVASDSSGRALAAFRVPLSSGTSQVGESDAPQGQAAAAVTPPAQPTTPEGSPPSPPAQVQLAAPTAQPASPQGSSPVAAPEVQLAAQPDAQPPQAQPAPPPGSMSGEVPSLPPPVQQAPPPDGSGEANPLSAD